MEKGKLFIYFLLTVSLLFFMSRIFFFSFGFLERFGSKILYPFVLVQKKISHSISDYWQRQENIKELLTIIKKEQLEKEQILEENIKLKASLDYNNEIQELLEFKNHYDFSQQILAQVIVKNFSDKTHFILVDAGTEKGIEKDMVAIYRNCLVGKVIECYPYYSKILLVTDKNCKVSVYCGNTKVNGVHEGLNLHDQTTLLYVPHYENLELNDIIISSGEGLVFPRGFALGKIKNFEKKDMTYDVFIEPLIDLRTIENCYIIKKGFLLQDFDCTIIPS